MSILYPEYLIFILVIVAVIFERKTKITLTARHYFLIASLVAISIALARPVLPKEAVEVDSAGSDIIFAVDLSYSMSATDIKPTRLKKAKEILADVVRSNTSDRFGVLGFSSNAIVLSPLTVDRTLLLHLFSGLNEKMVITKSTSIMPALKLARKMSRSKSLRLIILSDGGDEDSYTKEALYAKENNLIVDIVMIATASGSTLLDSKEKLLKDEKGNIVISSRNDALKELSSESGGEFITTLNASKIADLIQEQTKVDHRSKTKIMQYTELFYYFIILAIVTFMIAVTTLLEKSKALLIVVLALIGLNANANDSLTNYNSAILLYKSGEYEKSLNRFKTLKSSDPTFKADIFYNMASCYIRLSEFKKAREYLEKSLTLKYELQTYENLDHIKNAEEQDFMITGRQKGKKRVESGEREESQTNKNRKSGGGSNMSVDTSGKSGASDSDAKETKGDAMIDLRKNSAQLSSRQYELINKRSVNETNPW
ncbi:MAG: VWA domain-containing protein [Helicobacteraceae bacterium]|nr:VWA domain-containing protein [Helicobacteraceae bacterium]